MFRLLSAVILREYSHARDINWSHYIVTSTTANGKIIIVKRTTVAVFPEDGYGWSKHVVEACVYKD